MGTVNREIADTERMVPLPGGAYVLRLQNATMPVPDLYTMPDPGAPWKSVLVIQCNCAAGRDYRLGNLRAVKCERCGTIYARVGQDISCMPDLDPRLRMTLDKQPL